MSASFFNFVVFYENRASVLLTLLMFNGYSSISVYLFLFNNFIKNYSNGSRRKQ